MLSWSNFFRILYCHCVFCPEVRHAFWVLLPLGLTSRTCNALLSGPTIKVILYWRSRAQLSTEHPSWPTHRGTCPMVVFRAQEVPWVALGRPARLVRLQQAQTRRFRGYRKYLHRAIDRGGALVDVMLSEHRDLAAAKAFFRSAKAVTNPNFTTFFAQLPETTQYL
jgi:DDE domain